MRDRNEKENQAAMERMKARGFAPVTALELPHITCKELNGRLIPVYSFYDKVEGWHYWHENREGTLTPMMALPIECLYFGNTLERPQDHYFRLIDVVVQRCSWRKPLNLVTGIASDVHNLGSSIAKLRLVHGSRAESQSTSRMAATELEYVFGVCRAMHDLLQEFIQFLWSKITLLDKTLRQKNLPGSFARMILKGDERLTAAEIQRTYQLPLPLAEAYEASGEFFVWLRGFRDQVVHSGKSVDIIFEMDNGYGVKTDMKPFSTMDIWNENNTAPNEIGSFLSAISYVIGNTFDTMDRFATYVNEQIKGTEALALGCNIFVRGHHIDELNRLGANIDETPWYDSAPPPVPEQP